MLKFILRQRLCVFVKNQQLVWTRVQDGSLFQTDLKHVIKLWIIVKSYNVANVWKFDAWNEHVVWILLNDKLWNLNNARRYYVEMYITFMNESDIT